MSSLDDVPPLSAAMSAKESDSVFHMSLRRRTASQRSRSRSCPSGLNRKSPGGLGGHSPVCETNQDDGSKRTGATSEIASENQTSTVKIREEACVIKVFHIHLWLLLFSTSNNHACTSYINRYAALRVYFRNVIVTLQI